MTVSGIYFQRFLKAKNSITAASKTKPSLLTMGKNEASTVAAVHLLLANK